MTWGDWSISKECFDYIVENTPHGSTVLEFGSGWGSEQLSKHFEVWSVEDDLMWLSRYKTNYIYGHLRQYDWGVWYDIEEIMPQMPQTYKTILVDGPIGCFGRLGFLKFLDHFDTDALIIIDDVHCRPEHELFIELASILKRPCRIIKNEEKAFGIIERNKE